jgi:ribosomal protein S18 acetylase RimI-like enzyme
MCKRKSERFSPDIDGLGTSCYDAFPDECMKMPSLRFGKPSERDYRIRPARNSDWPAIEKLLSYAGRQYLALEWWTVQEWLGSPTFLLITDDHGRGLGLMLTITGDAPIAWLRVISVASDKYLAPLLDASIQAVLAQGGTGLAFLGDEGWVSSELRRAGFQRVNHVVTLRRRRKWSMRQGPPDLQVRRATADDLDAILALDHVAFPPLWWYSRETLTRALSIGYSYDVAYLAGECVGYQLSTLRNGRGHIVRLAVPPQWQRKGIGGRLLSEAMKTLDEAMADSVTVNTQEDNLASLQLYRRFSFDRIGRPWAVWFRSLE